MKNINLSEAMKRAHASGKHPGWAHINSNKDKLSYPEKFLKQVLTNNNIFSRFTIESHHCVGRFFLDFAIMELKLDIEMDGEQHFRTIEAIEHDKRRDKFLKEEGWTIYRISWSNMIKNSKQEIKELLEFIDNFENGLDRYYDIVKKEKIISLGRGVKAKIKNDIKWEPFKEIVINSGINFSKFGWVTKVSKILNLPQQKVNRWMKRYLPDVYEIAFKKKQSAPLRKVIA